MAQDLKSFLEANKFNTIMTEDLREFGLYDAAANLLVVRHNRESKRSAAVQYFKKLGIHETTYQLMYAAFVLFRPSSGKPSGIKILRRIFQQNSFPYVGIEYSSTTGAVSLRRLGGSDSMPLDLSTPRSILVALKLLCRDLLLGKQARAHNFHAQYALSEIGALYNKMDRLLLTTSAAPAVEPAPSPHTPSAQQLQPVPPPLSIVSAVNTAGREAAVKAYRLQWPLVKGQGWSHEPEVTMYPVDISRTPNEVYWDTEREIRRSTPNGFTFMQCKASMMYSCLPSRVAAAHIAQAILRTMGERYPKTPSGLTSGTFMEAWEACAKHHQCAMDDVLPEELYEYLRVQYPV